MKLGSSAISIKSGVYSFVAVGFLVNNFSCRELSVLLCHLLRPEIEGDTFSRILWFQIYIASNYVVPQLCVRVIPLICMQRMNCTEAKTL